MKYRKRETTENNPQIAQMAQMFWLNKKDGEINNHRAHGCFANTD